MTSPPSALADEHSEGERFIPVKGTPPLAQNAASFEGLDELFAWFLANPPDATGSNFAERRQHTKLIDRYGQEIPAPDWQAYRSSWKTDPPRADKLEQTWPILHYLRAADQHAFSEIRNTPVVRGFVLWHVYNMGYVVKTRNKCFAMDLVARDSTNLVDILDFVICSHGHSDHYDTPFLDAMVVAGKPVFSPFYEKGTIISTNRECRLGEITARFTLSHQQTNTPVIISQIDLGQGADHYTIYNIADARPAHELHPTRHVNLFITHIANGFNIFDAVAQVNPDATIYAHEMELAHTSGRNRWTYEFAYRKINSQPHRSSYILTWGEKIDRRY